MRHAASEPFPSHLLFLPLLSDFAVTHPESITVSFMDLQHFSRGSHSVRSLIQLHRLHTKECLLFLSHIRVTALHSLTRTDQQQCRFKHLKITVGIWNGETRFSRWNIIWRRSNGVFGVALFPNRAKLFCCVGDDGGGEGLAIQGQGEKKRREWKEGKDMRKEEKKADRLSHASNNKALWETNETSVEWTLCGKPRIPLKTRDNKHYVHLLKTQYNVVLINPSNANGPSVPGCLFTRSFSHVLRTFLKKKLPPDFSRNTQRTDASDGKRLSAEIKFSTAL